MKGTIKIGKKAAWLPPLKEALVIIIAVIIISLIFALLLFGGRSDDIKEIEETGQALRDQKTLNSLLRAPIRTSIPIIKEKGFGIEIAYADLILLLSVEQDNDLKDKYKELLEARAEFILDNAYGDGNWELKINIPNNFLEFGGAGGESTEAIIPSYDGQLIRIYLITEQ
ncbi:MAG TPA: hypothetical protein VJC00_03595 [Candidatus Nanoarchaeia archaeon]|nr:hypothetical protein [Candidatus Nanoarchaeia archaeon]